MTVIRDAALAMAARGFPVFPLQPNSKKPYVLDECEPRYRELAGGQNAATRDPQRIARWFEVNEFINYAVSTDGMVVIDVDVKNGKNGLEDLLDLGDLPTTLTVVTPTGGAHYYFSGSEVSQRPLSKSLDVRSKGGYVVGPSSIINNEPYVIWYDVPAAPLPQHVYDRMAAPPERDPNAAMPVVELDQDGAIEAAVAYLKLEPIVETGGRNNAAFRLACRLKDFGLSARSIHEKLQEYWNCRNPEPLPEGEIEAIAENCFKSGRHAPGCASPEAEFGDVPELLKGIYAANEGTSFGPVSPGRSISLIPPRPWLVPGLLLKGGVTLLAAQPGARKSTFTVALAVGCALGTLAHLGFNLKSDPMDVVLINNEDDEDEIDRRIAACCLLHDFADRYEEAKARIHIWKPINREPFRAIARHPKARVLVRTPAIEELRRYIELKRIKLVIADPLASLHDGAENDNGEMARVFAFFIQLLRATETLPMLLVHHSRKPDAASSESYAGDPFSSRGASAIHGAVRLMVTLNTCNEKDALALGLRGENAHLDYSRLDKAKDSNSKLGKDTIYFRCEGVRVGEADDTAPALQLIDHKEQTELLINELHEILSRHSHKFDQQTGSMPIEQAAEILCGCLPIDEETALGYLDMHFRTSVSRVGVTFRIEGRSKKAVLTTDLTCGVSAD